MPTDKMASRSQPSADAQARSPEAPRSDGGWTPGRWNFHGWPNLPRVSTPDGKSVCGVHKIGRFSGTVSTEVVANGHLLAASKELYEALQAARTAITSNSAPIGLVDQIDAAISRALGLA